jgi:mannose-1-phosphate guanylyltransferase
VKALLLAAGFGTRLRPLTDTTPKCLVPIAGKPLIKYWLEMLDQEGMPALVNTHYLSQQVEEYIRAQTFQSEIKVVHEEHLLGTGGTLLKNKDFF